MIDARIELAPNSTMAPLRSQRLATTGVFVANGMGIGCWAAAIPRVKADLALSDATLSVALLSFAAGAIIAMPLMGLFAHRLRSGPASVIAGLGFAAVLAALGFARSLETLSAATFLAGATHGAMDVAMNANASDLERRWGRPIMSSFHAGYQPRAAQRARCWAGGSGNWERFGASWVPPCSRLCWSPSRLRLWRARAAVSAARRLRRPAGASCRSPRWRSCRCRPKARLATGAEPISRAPAWRRAPP